MEKEVKILKNTSQIPPCDLFRNKGDTIVWVNPMDQDYFADFGNDSPFKDANFTIKANGRKSSGPLKTEAEAKEYRYDLAPAKVGVVAADPTVIVH